MCYQNENYHVRQKGNTLVSLLVSVLLGSMVLLASMVLLQTVNRHLINRRHFMQMWRHAMMIENLLKMRSQQSGVSWCVPLTGDLTINGQPEQANQLSHLSAMQIFALPQRYSQKLRRSGSGQAVKGLPVLLFRFIEPSRLLLWHSAVTQLNLPLTPKIRAGDQLIMANCQHWLSQHVQSVHDSQQQYVKLSQQVATFSSGTLVYVGLYQQVVYYIGKTTRRDKQGHSVLALYELNARGIRQELVQGMISWSLHAKLHNKLVQIDWVMHALPGQRPLRLTTVLLNEPIQAPTQFSDLRAVNFIKGS